MNNHSFLAALGYDKTCSTSADKCDTNKGLACDSGTKKCACSSGTYRSEIGECTDQKLLGESCSSSGSGNCYTASKLHCIIYFA